MDNNLNPLSETSWTEWAQALKSRYGLELSSEAVLQCRAYLNELKTWNENINLVSFRSEQELLWRHFTDSLMGIDPIEKHSAQNIPKRIIDIGTGAGFPGFIIKIAKPDYDVTLVESLTKKCKFLEHMKEVLNISGLTIINERAEVLGQDKIHRGKYDFSVSRALSKLPPNLETTLPLVKTGGCSLVYKTQEFAKEALNDIHISQILKTLNAKIKDLHNYNICELANSFSIIVFEKIGPTPLMYPRRPGMPEKKPL
jgi:16S rRNA (guanine527-N7)-methyltransferase